MTVLFLLVTVGLGSDAQSPEISSSGSGADVRASYIYQRAGTRSLGRGIVETELGLGTREARPLGASGFESGVRLGVNIGSRLDLQGYGGAVFTRAGFRSSAWSGELTWRWLSQAEHFVDLAVAAGFMRDYEHVSIPRLRVTAGHTFGRLDTAFSGLFEVPQASGRDAVDVIFSAATSYLVTDDFSAGVELVGEDLEGLFEAEEAEGGAHFLMGPTLWYRPGARFHIKLNGAAVVNGPARPVPGSDDSTAAAGNDSTTATRAGLLVRMVAGYDFE